MKTIFYFSVLMSFNMMSCSGDPETSSDPNRCYFKIDHVAETSHNFPIRFSVYEGSKGYPTTVHINKSLIDANDFKFYSLPKGKQYHFRYEHHPFGAQYNGCVESTLKVSHPETSEILKTLSKNWCNDNNRWTEGTVDFGQDCLMDTVNPFVESFEPLNQ